MVFSRKGEDNLSRGKREEENCSGGGSQPGGEGKSCCRRGSLGTVNPRWRAGEDFAGERILLEGESGRRCPLCNAQVEETEELECFACPRCQAISRYSGEQLLAMHIPHYYLRLEELRRRNSELVGLIESESGRGASRDMRALRSLHEERQRVLSEYSFLSYFEQFVQRW